MQKAIMIVEHTAQEIICGSPSLRLSGAAFTERLQYRMNADSRRKEIVKCLEIQKGPLSAGKLASQLGVSRQIIVGDIALLRASGTDITATPRGYILTRKNEGLVFRIPCRHRPDDMQKELEIMVDNGCLVRDVIVEHPVYGQLTGPLDVATRHDVAEFMNKVLLSDAAPLSDLTGGIHLHTVFCPDRSAYERIIQALREEGFLYEDKD